MSVIPLLRPSCTEQEITAVMDVLRSGWWGQGPKCAEFERRCAEMHKRDYCATTNSATAALHLALLALDIGPGDEVIVPALTFISTALAVTYTGATPVFADVQPGTLTMDHEHARTLANERTKAVIPVDYAGHPAGRPQWFAGPVIQDAAHHFGGQVYGDVIAYSFHPVKNLGTGDGGALLTDDAALYERVKALRWCGIQRSTYERTEKRYGWDYDIQEIGYKYHWNDIQAAIGLAQLRRWNELQRKRREIADWYRLLLDDVPGLELPRDHIDHTWHLFPVRVPAAMRDRVIDYLLSCEISAGVHYKPLTLYPMYAQPTPAVTEREWQRLVSLPIYYDLTFEQVKFIAFKLREIVTQTIAS